MSDGLLIYLLSISEGVSCMAFIAAVVLLIAALAIKFGPGVVAFMELKERPAKPTRSAKPCLIGAAVLGFVAAAIPSPKAILAAYLMVEGRKVATAENAEAAADAAMTRIDRVLDAIEGRDKAGE